MDRAAWIKKLGQLQRKAKRAVQDAKDARANARHGTPIPASVLQSREAYARSCENDLLEHQNIFKR